MALLACLGMIVPTPFLQAAVPHGNAERHTAAPLSTAADIALHSGGILLGQVVDPNGTPLPGVRVSLRQLDREVAAAVSDQSGRFVANRLRGGSYQIAAGQTLTTCRAWAPNTAPPNARHGVLIVLGNQPVRGQDGPLGYWLCNPLVLAGLTAIAVAIPVAIHNHRLDRTTSP
jgi:hypothetical protein